MTMTIIRSLQRILALAESVKVHRYSQTEVANAYVLFRRLIETRHTAAMVAVTE
jgi:arginyl-tRNA--protein-N-Asp/Glu arginylyltransferase